MAGNIRELENAVKRTIILLNENSQEISEQDFYMISSDKMDDKIKSSINQLSKLIINKKQNLKSIERLLLKDILEHFEGNIMEAVRYTNISKNKFYNNKDNRE